MRRDLGRGRWQAAQTEYDPGLIDARLPPALPTTLAHVWASALADTLRCCRSRRVVNEVKGVSRLISDIHCKPRATIEWE
ncbi:MAG: hypothetical protein KJS73_06480 [Gammaproteobacteria bacterium]|nr:hypothetical protein [Gammaproteobacteria bacterium]